MKKVSLIISLLVFYTYFSFGQNDISGPIVQYPVYFDVSPPLRDMVKNPPPKADNSWKDGIVKNHFNLRQKPSGQAPGGLSDPSLQTKNGLILTDTTIVNFDGNTNTQGFYPPDTYGDVGPNHYFQVVNCHYSIYSKNGTLLLGPLDNSSIFTGLPNNFNDGDAVVLYDDQADRWLFSQFSLPSFPNGPFYQMIAVSQTADPTGSWYRYQYTFTDMPDYPKFGIWPDAYYMSMNRFASGSTSYVGIGAVAYNRTLMLAGNPSAAMEMFTKPASDEASSWLPSDCDGPFPTGTPPNYFLYVYDGASDDHLGIYEFHVDWVTPANATFGNFLSLPVTAFTANIIGIPQPGTTQKLDVINDRMMYRLQYRHFSDHEALVGNHTVDVTGTTAGIRWYELRKTSGAFSIYQSGTYSLADNNSRWMGSIAQDSSGNIALGYSVGGASLYPSIRYCGRKKNDALGTMTIAERGIFIGTGSQLGTADRWGDYSSMVCDPVAKATYWYTQEYYATTSSTGWRTRIASFKFGNSPSLTTLAATAVTGSSATLNGTINPNGLSSTYHFEWGTTISYGNSTPITSAGSGSSNVAVSANISGLTTGTPYHYRIVGVNTDGTTNGNDITFTTLCGNYNLPFNENFATTSIPGCWSQVDHQGNGQIWQFGTITGYSPNPALTGNYAYLNSDAYGNGNSQNADLVTPLLDLSGYSTINLQFNHYFRSWTGSSGTLSYSITGGSTWIQIQQWTSSSANPAIFNQAVNAVAGQAQVKFKWNYTGTFGYYWAIDDVQITGLPIDMQLSNITIPNGTNNCYNASQTITVADSGNTFTVQNGGSVTLIAGLNIHIMPGATVQSGGYFWGTIAPSGPFCVNPIYMPSNTGNITENNTDLPTIFTGDLFKVYPNPTSGNFILELNGDFASSIANVEVFGMRGEKVLTTVLTGERKREFSLSDRPAGIYFIRVISGSKAASAKIIKQ